MKLMNSKCAIFLFAHQDDEFGVFHMISEELQGGSDVWCLYFTDGGTKTKKRNSESFDVLSNMGVLPANIIFIGQDCAVEDGHLVSSLSVCAAVFYRFIVQRENIHSIYVPAWEGGHPDHDGLNFICTVVAHNINILDRLYQFPLYNAFQMPKPFFRVMSPLKENGEIVVRVIPFRKRWAYILKCCRYPSQISSWIGLFPFVFIAYIFIGRQFLQRVSLTRLGIRPHKGPLYYEMRGLSNWTDLYDIFSNHKYHAKFQPEIK